MWEAKCIVAQHACFKHTNGGHSCPESRSDGYKKLLLVSSWDLLTATLFLPHKTKILPQRKVLLLDPVFWSKQKPQNPMCTS